MSSYLNRLSEDELNKLKIGDSLLYGYWINSNNYYNYHDKVKIIDNNKIYSEFGLCFINGKSKMNGEFFYLEKEREEIKSNIHPYMNKISIDINKKLHNILTDQDKRGEQIEKEWMEQNALIEKKYRDKNSRYINYFDTLLDCIGYTYVNGSIYNNGEMLIKRCSKSIGKYRLFRMNIDNRKGQIPKWQTSLIVIYDSESGKIRRDHLNLYYYAWYWLEREIKSYDDNYVIKYGGKFENTNMYYYIKTYYKNLED